MKLKADQLKDALKKKLAPVYFISGDEPLQLGDAADASLPYDMVVIFPLFLRVVWYCTADGDCSR